MSRCVVRPEGANGSLVPPDDRRHEPVCPTGWRTSERAARAPLRGPRALLPTAPREPLDRGDARRAVGRSLPRLERAHQAECYRPNAFARIVDDHGMVVAIVNNYSLLGFNVGPTLASWLAEHAPDARADVAGRPGTPARRWPRRYNHSILPLATRRDVRTQIRWGLADFGLRFGRRAEGIWLPETAVNDEVLAALVEEGVGFTVLAPAARPPTPVEARHLTAWGEHPDAAGVGLDPRVLRRPLSHDIAFGSAGPSAGRWSTGPAGGARRRPRASWPPTARPSATTTSSPSGRWPTPSRSRRRSGAAAWAPGGLAGRPSAHLDGRPCGRARGAAPTVWAGGGRTAVARRGRRPGWQPGLAAPAARRPRPAARPRRRRCSTPGHACSRDPWAARDAYVDVLLAHSRRRPSSPPTPAGRRSRRGPGPARGPAPRAADVHIVRLVLPRPGRARDGAGPALRRPVWT